MELLLTNEELSLITKDYQTDPIYRYYFGRKIYYEKYPITEILSVSDKNCLIMVKGNSDTGYDHIRERHSFFTTKIYKKKDNNEVGFQHPSKFPSSIAPIDFVRIADAIFSPENEVKDNQHDGAKYFDLYVATVVFPNIEKPEPIRLAVYKNTRIIHTLYPVRDTFTRKIKRVDKFIYHREVVEIEYYKNNTVLQIRIPYLDVEKKLWYAIFIDKDFNANIEYWSILVFLGHHISKYKIDYLQQPLIKLDLYRAFYQYADLRTTEKFIKDFDEKFKAGLVTLPEN